MIAEKIIVLATYLDFADIFLKKTVAKFSKYLNMNKHVIDLEADKQPSYKLIYSLDVVKLKTFNIYIKTNLANGFIHPFKFLAKTFILFVQKFNNSLRLYINYRGLNNLIIKNWYHFRFIKKSLD